MTDLDDIFEGGCLCGRVRYRITGRPFDINLCYCRSCRMATGAPVAAFADCKADTVEWIRSGPAFYASSPGVQRGFCSTCGTALSYQGDNLPGEIHVLMATLDDPNRLVPTAQVFADEKPAWLDVLVEGRRLPDEGTC